MSPGPDPGSTDEVQALRGRLRADLLAAMKARRPEAVAALRIAIAAIDNAEAVEAPERAPGGASEHVAGAATGIGATEADRRVLSLDDVREILRAQVEERRTEADRCDALGQHAAADGLRRGTEALLEHVDR
jgi:uncharacterized protein